MDIRREAIHHWTTAGQEVAILGCTDVTWDVALLGRIPILATPDPAARKRAWTLLDAPRLIDAARQVARGNEAPWVDAAGGLEAGRRLLAQVDGEARQNMTIALARGQAWVVDPGNVPEIPDGSLALVIVEAPSATGRESVAPWSWPRTLATVRRILAPAGRALVVGLPPEEVQEAGLHVAVAGDNWVLAVRGRDTPPA